MPRFQFKESANGPEIWDNDRRQYALWCGSGKIYMTSSFRVFLTDAFQSAKPSQMPEDQKEQLIMAALEHAEETERHRNGADINE